jgi:hypothetical protein
MEAFEALNIATINVLSAGMMFTGGVLYAFDISTLDDMRRKVRSSAGADGPRPDQDAEKEIEAWLASVFHTGSTADKESEESKNDKEPTILEMVSKLQDSQAQGGLNKDGVVSILDRISKLEEERKKNEEKKS